MIFSSIGWRRKKQQKQLPRSLVSNKSTTLPTSLTHDQPHCRLLPELNLLNQTIRSLSNVSGNSTNWMHFQTSQTIRTVHQPASKRLQFQQVQSNNVRKTKTVAQRRYWFARSMRQQPVLRLCLDQQNVQPFRSNGASQKTQRCESYFPCIPVLLDESKVDKPSVLRVKCREIAQKMKTDRCI